MDTIRGKFLKQHLLSDEFLDLIEKNKRPMDELMSYYQCAIMEVETKFKVLNQEYSLEYDRNPIEGIKTRVKSYDSILRKIRRKNIPMTLEGIEENIRDIAGVRVICSFPDDIYELVESFLRQDDITLIERKDYIKNPKESGYRSLHLVTYDYGSSPSLAYWIGKQKRAAENLHFLSNGIRLKYIAELRQKTSILYRAKYRLQRQLQRVAGSVMA
jgi:hypothetical protein